MTETLRALNRERQRTWRMNNIEKSRALKREWNRKNRAHKAGRTYIPGLPCSPGRARSVPNYGLVSTKEVKEIAVSLCRGCDRTYLEKLGCVFCKTP